MLEGSQAEKTVRAVPRIFVPQTFRLFASRTSFRFVIAFAFLSHADDQGAALCGVGNAGEGAGAGERQGDCQGQGQNPSRHRVMTIS